MTREEYEEFYKSWCNSQMSGDAFALIANNYIFNLELKIKMQETIIRDKTAIIDSITLKDCLGCKYLTSTGKVTKEFCHKCSIFWDSNYTKRDEQ